MCDSLLKLQDLLESGNKLSNQDILAISRGFTNFNECSRYRKWRRNEGKSTSYEDDDFTSDLEWWRIHVDYSTVSTFIEYAKKQGYTVTREVLSKFQKWSYHKGLSHSNSEEYLALYVEYLNVLSKRDSIEEVLSSLPEGSSKEDAIAVSLGFKDCKERRVYDGTCRRLGFTYSSDKDRYLNGIADWKRQKNLKKQ